MEMIYDLLTNDLFRWFLGSLFALIGFIFGYVKWKKQKELDRWSVVRAHFTEYIADKYDYVFSLASYLIVRDNPGELLKDELAELEVAIENILPTYSSFALIRLKYYIGIDLQKTITDIFRFFETRLVIAAGVVKGDLVESKDEKYLAFVGSHLTELHGHTREMTKVFHEIDDLLNAYEDFVDRSWFRHTPSRFQKSQVFIVIKQSLNKSLEKIRSEKKN